MSLRIKEIAKKKGLSLNEVAQGIGITYTAFFRRIDNPKLSTLEEVSKVLDCEMAELLPLGEDFMHIYNEQGEWQGIMKKPK